MLLMLVVMFNDVGKIFHKQTLRNGRAYPVRYFPALRRTGKSAAEVCLYLLRRKLT